MSQHVFSIRANLIVFAILMALMVLTVVVALYLDLGLLEIPIALTIATIKAVVIMLYFMHLRYSSRLTWLFAGSGTFWLLILIAFSLSDFLSRDWISPVLHSGESREIAAAYFGGLPDPDTALEDGTHAGETDAHHSSGGH
ncbi:cytochrome C oxidase subunit IV family protein [Tautonia sp. JC769]|uniref:cytochrome C oxidase subunit IV family protein n=1 Tax=Tautonia sp. JC769 TaxID=3232135 RepID=UPI00345B20FC